MCDVKEKGSPSMANHAFKIQTTNPYTCEFCGVKKTAILMWYHGKYLRLR